MQIILLAIPVIVFGGAGYLIYFLLAWEVKRRKALEALAPSLGLSFTKGPFPPGSPIYSGSDGLALFQNRREDGAENVLSGRIDGIDIQVFDYHYSEGHGNQSHYIHSTAAKLTADGFALPSTLDLHPEGVFSKIGAALGAQNINFPAYPEFSRRFVLKGEDETFVRALIDAPTAAFFEAHQGLTVYGSGRYLSVHRSVGRRTKLADMRTFVDEMLAVFRTVSASIARATAGGG